MGVLICLRMLQQAFARLWHQPGVGLAPPKLHACVPHRAAVRAQPPRTTISTRAISGSVYCDDAESLSQAIAAVRKAGSCVLDCEGHELADPAGQLTIIQIVPIKPPSVPYVIDVLALQQQPDALQPLKELLSDPAVTKVLFDCRNDSGALWHEQQCKLQVGYSLMINQLDHVQVSTSVTGAV